MLRIKVSPIERWMLALAAVGVMSGGVAGYYLFVAGLVVGLMASLLLLRWQLAAARNEDNLHPIDAHNRLMFRSLIRTGVALTLLTLAVLKGIELLFGVLAGLFLQVAAYMGQAALIILRKEGKKVGTSGSGRDHDPCPPG
ncbi:hypothetical protein MTHERMOG20_15230 [Moorella thermoacetica]|uniref:ATP synthase subunit i n=2 Tax=Neomoorella thermoacetica TaxID=1525 RepID=O05427_NEOTH|nr:hypothetical protein [Moorella thermoacetica]AAB51459.1 ATP synthase subunit i [Moorella thermoacetica]AKX95243.1 hypothetical protein MOTHE_c24640 [Moorella thermoacetica]AKX97868.1 hypothetical protein MOTHA_c25360 [Moorella thermoacetica]OIQ56699.1 hypothetical protein MOCA_12760 [Moorella thermoacetica]QDA01687.1 hypothetical protein MothHH_02581 [Moorella thermoacetica]